MGKIGAWFRKIETWLKSNLKEAKYLFSWHTSDPNSFTYKYTSIPSPKDTKIAAHKPYTNLKKPWHTRKLQTYFQLNSSPSKHHNLFLEVLWSFPNTHRSSNPQEIHSTQLTVCHFFFEIRFLSYMHSPWILLISLCLWCCVWAFWCIQLSFKCRFEVPPLLGLEASN